MRQSIGSRKWMLIAWLFFAICTAKADSENLPIVLRLEPVSLNESGLPSTAASSAKTTQEVFWLSVTSLLTFGAPLLDLPNVLDRGEARAHPIQMCLKSWDEIRNGPSSWFKSDEIRKFALQTLEQELVRLIAGRALAVKVQTEAGGNNAGQENPATEGEKAGHDKEAGVLANVSILVDPSSSEQCEAQLRLSAKLFSGPHSAAVAGSKSGELNALLAVSLAEPLAVHEWASDPEVGRTALRIVLLQLATAIADAYPWRVGDESGPAQMPSMDKDKASTTGR